MAAPTGRDGNAAAAGTEAALARALGGCWGRWRERFEEHGLSAVAPGWPGEPGSVAEARAHPDVFAGKRIGQVTTHHAEVVQRLARRPIVVGHSFGGLIVQQLAGMGLA